MLSLLAVGLILRIATAAQNVRLPSQCDCGFIDPSTQRTFTDSIILYFNETQAVDEEVFSILDYRKRVQKGWNTIFRQGADPSNVGIGNNDSLSWQDSIDGTAPSLEMFLNTPTFNHDSVGAELRTLRQDILYGTFRASMRSAQPWIGGSAMSMFLSYNETVGLEMDMLNKDAAPNAQIMQIIDGEWPENNIAVNYSWIQDGSPPAIPPRSPWDFLELRMDWTMESVEFWVENNKTRAVTIDDHTIPNIPQPLYFSHWSTGDAEYMMGPPINRSVANVRYVRAFFNTSSMSDADHATFDERCTMTAPCSIDDMTLRGSSPFPESATQPWKQPVADSHIRKIAGYIAAAFSTFGIASLLNAFVRRTPWSKIKNIYLPGSRKKSTRALRRSLRTSMGPANPSHVEHDSVTDGTSTPMTPAPGYTSPAGAMTPLPAYQSRLPSPWQSVSSLLPKRSKPSLSGRNTPSQTPVLSRSASLSRDHVSRPSGSTQLPIVGSIAESEGFTTTNPPRIDEKEEEHDVEAARAQAYIDLGGEPQDSRSNSSSKAESYKSSSYDDEKHAQFGSDEKESEIQVVDKTGPPADEVPTEKSARALLHEKPVVDALMGAANVDTTLAKAAPQQRIDYLAGLTAISCLFVTLRHASLTFWPYVTEGQGPVKHFEADQILSYILGPYLLTPFWIGPFFVTSCRFLVQRYLRTGKLNDVGNKMMLRAPRMLIPCFIFMALEYFLISLGLTSSLETLPSVSFSTWPYVQPQANFGVFLNEMVELAYIQPNAAPQVISNYCVGILWTIPVQLQFSFVTLFAGVIMYDIKTPWKRMCFYVITIAAGWYGTSWSACHWLGLMLADLDLTYDWVKWVQKRWWALYPLLTLATGFVFVAPLMLLFNSSFYAFPFMAWENGIHPDPTTGRPIVDTVDSIWAAYPPYYYPSIGILAFSAGLQIIVEFSTWMQKLLSMKIITFLHPHIMTIYLMHGFIFWSLGAYIAVSLAKLNTPYWANLIATLLCCYTVIFLLSQFITPLIDFVTKGITKNLWRWATDVPVPHRTTLAPFSKDLVVGRMAEEKKEEKTA